MSSSIKFKGADVDVIITYKSAMFDLPKLGINLLNIFEDQSTLFKILTNDEVMLQVWYYYVKAHCSTFENAIEDLTPEMMHEFRTVFWNAVINFTSPQMRPALQETMTMIKRELSSPKQRLEKALSESLEEQE